MKHSFVIIILSVFFICCNQRIADKESSNQNFDSSKEVLLNPAPAQVPVASDISKLQSDSSLLVENKDTLDCGAIINTLFHRSLYKFPVDNGFEKEELTAVIEDAKDSVLSIKIMLVDTVSNDRLTVDWLTLNCKSKEFQTIPKDGTNNGIRRIKYDTRFLDILMRKCALNY
ncbi:hypothetical protein DVR12_17710 [Chitinophaga silvatica]|uniref:Uncharacterized protein n=1 Tax=Chitinophaga silvatica TaxID=2282649 RepID=A0A3E1Y7V8_9BACT|nr:hypothetical protein [Chitinophaga silvatica]RFS21170.1 hypothetical protein DVR12_17710 [Chitinophaga silvatica]